MFLLGNDIAREVLRVSEAEGVPLRKALAGTLLRRGVVEYSDDTAKWGARWLAKRALLRAMARAVGANAGAFTPVTATGGAVGRLAVPLAGSFVMGQIKKNDACVQVIVDRDRGKLKVDWSMVYAHSSSAKLTKSKVNRKIDRALAVDDYKPVPTGMSFTRGGGSRAPSFGTISETCPVWEEAPRGTYARGVRLKGSAMLGKSRTATLGLAGLAALAVVVVTPTAQAGGEDLAHAEHNPPGNTSVAYPLADNVRHVGGSQGITGGHVAIEGDRMYVGAYGAGMRIFDISDRESPRQIGSYLPGVRADAVPDAAVFGGRHIATLNGTRRVTATDLRTDRTEFLDVTDPARPKVLWTFVGPADGEAHNGDIIDSRQLWLASGGSGVNGLRIYDLNPLLGATAAAPANLFRGDPGQLWAASPYRNGRPIGAPFTHTHDMTAYVDYPVKQADGSYAPRDIVLLAEGGNYTNNDGDTGSVFVIDITDPRNPVVLNRWLHARGPGHHPIRYHHEAQFLEGDRTVMLTTDEDMHNGCGSAGGVTAVRLSDDLTRVTTELSEWFVPLGTPAPVCSVHVFSSQGSLVFLGSYNAGLQVVDYSDPAAPKQAGYNIQPGTTAWGAQVHDDVIYVGDMARGLDVFTLDDPELLLKLKLKPKPLRF